MKKITGIILLISILLSFSFPVSAKPYNDDATTKAELLAELGIIDEITDETKLNDEVTRRDFIIATAKMLGINIYEGNQNRYYKDMTQDDIAWNASGVLLEVGILTMDDSRTFRPNDIITMDEAACVIVKALGVKGIDYNTTLEIARRSDVLDGVKNARICWSDAITLLHNALITPMYNTYADTGYGGFNVKQGSETLMEVYYDLFHTEGIVNAVNDTSLINETGYDKNTICVGDTVINAHLYDPYKYLGRYVSVYYTDKTDGNPELKYISVRDNNTNTIVINIDDFVSFEADSCTINYFDGSRAKKVVLDKGVNIVKNGENASKDISAVFDNISNGEIILINADSNSTYETVMVNAYENIVVRSVDLEDRMIYGRGSQVIDLSDDEKTTIITTASGEERSLSDIVQNNVISFYASNRMNRLVVSAGTITGDISSITNPNGNTIIKIGQSEYVVDSAFIAANPDYLAVRMKVTCYIDAYGKIADIVAGGASGGIYAYIIGHWMEELDEAMYLKLFTENGEITNLPLAKNVNIDGVKCDTYEEAETAMSVANGKVNGQIVIVDVNSDNKIRLIDTVNEGKRQNGLFVSSPESEYYFYSGQMLIGPLVQINSSSRLFVVPQSDEYKNDPDAYQIAKGNQFFKDWERYKIEGYRTGDPSDVGYTEAMLLKSDMVGTSGFSTNSTNLFVVSDICDVYDENTETVKEQITLLSGTAK
ncbi:MAG: hypothetical protein J6N52_00090 [Clostridia bacterium]|nr:hypothetical protein [Clostridia bacterium]